MPPADPLQTPYRPPTDPSRAPQEPIRSPCTNPIRAPFRSPADPTLTIPNNMHHRQHPPSMPRGRIYIHRPCHVDEYTSTVHATWTNIHPPSMLRGRMYIHRPCYVDEYTRSGLVELSALSPINAGVRRVAHELAGGFPRQEHEDQAYWYLLRGVFQGTLADHATPPTAEYIVQVTRARHGLISVCQPMGSLSTGNIRRIFGRIFEMTCAEWYASVDSR
eukprot:1191992-Prorocentrum_minimum.AAC.1